MEKSNILLSLFLVFSSLAFAQEKTGWNAPMHEIKFFSGDSNDAKMNIDPGFQYADLKKDDREYRLFFHNDISKFKNIRIVDQDSKLEIAKGRGSYFWGSARLEFVNGEEFRVKAKRKGNGYEIIGPYGPVFAVENFGMKPIETLNEKDFLAQSFYVFWRIKSTQTPPADVIYFAAPTTTFNNN